MIDEKVLIDHINKKLSSAKLKPDQRKIYEELLYEIRSVTAQQQSYTPFCTIQGAVDTSGKVYCGGSMGLP